MESPTSAFRAQVPSRLQYTPDFSTPVPTALPWQRDPKYWESEVITLLVVPPLITGLALIAVLLRLASATIRRRWKSTDYATLTAIILVLGLEAQSVTAVMSGAGMHQNKYTRVEDNLRLLRVIFAWRINSHLAKLAAQTAVLLMIKDSFSLKNRYFKWAWSIIVTLTATTYLTTIGFDIFRCNPIQSMWDSTISDPKCLDGRIVAVASEIAVGITSVMTLALPILPMFSAKVSWQRKGWMGALWFFAFFITWCIGPNVVYGIQMSGSTDIAWDFVAPLIVSLCEAGAGIIVACVPAIEMLLQHFRKRDDEKLADGGNKQGEENVEPGSV